MAYEVTATRRRPQTFNDVIGQEFVVATLKNAIDSGKIAHAYLFSGPRGCGKTTSARLLAKALNCVNGPTSAPCGECSSCVEIAKGSSVDVIEIDGASNTSVNDIRQIKDEILFPPTSSKYKIYIIDEVHMLSTSAFNALLKTIEEPPPYVIFIFATTELHKVPATIKSRCQQFNFRLGSVDQIKNLLVEAANEIGLKADDEALYWVAREATGSFRDAYTLFDQVAAFSEGHLTYDKIRDKLGLLGVEQLNEIAEICVDGKTNLVIEKIDEILQSGISIEQFISNYTDYIRNLLLIKTGITKESLLGQSIERFSKKVLGAYNPIQLERALSLFLELYRNIRYSISPRYELEFTFSRMCWLSSYVSSYEVKQAIDSAKALLSGQPRTDISESSALTEDKINDRQDDRKINASTGNIPKGMPVFSVLASQNSDQEKVRESPPFQDSGYQNQKEELLVTATIESQDNNENERDKEDVIANANSITVFQIKEKLLHELTVLDTPLSSLLNQISNWDYKVIENNGVLTLQVETEFLKNQIEQKKSSISSVITKIFGIKVNLQILLQKKEIKNEVIEKPKEVELLCNVFKGNIVNVEKISTKIEYKDESPIIEEGEENEY